MALRFFYDALNALDNQRQKNVNDSDPSSLEGQRFKRLHLRQVQRRKVAIKLQLREALDAQPALSEQLGPYRTDRHVLKRRRLLLKPMVIVEARTYLSCANCPNRSPCSALGEHFTELSPQDKKWSGSSDERAALALS